MLRLDLAFRIGRELGDPNGAVGNVRDIHCAIVINEEARIIVTLVNRKSEGLEHQGSNAW